MDQSQGYDLDISQVLVPTGLPEKPDLKDLPTSILRSGAVEALINQNDDLMARLNVALRRNSQLEETLSTLEKEKRIFNHQLDILKDKLLLVQEKEKLHSGRDKKYADEISHLRDELRLAETRYVELYGNSKDRSKTLLTRIEELGQRLARLLKYRNKVKTLIRIQKTQKLAMKAQIQKLQTLISSQDVRIEDLQKRIDEMTSYIQTQGRKSHEDKTNLIEIYEGKLQILTQTATEQKEKLERYNSTMNENVSLKNQLIAEQRAKDEISKRLNDNVVQLQAQVTELSTHSKMQTLSLHHKEQEFDEAMQTQKILESEKVRLTDQVESLQVLWADAQKQVENKIGRVESLQKLNQQLSVALNILRKENESLKSKIDSVGHIANDRLKALKGEFKQARLEPEMASRIEGIVTEIQSGLEQKKSMETPVDTPLIDA